MTVTYDGGAIRPGRAFSPASAESKVRRHLRSAPEEAPAARADPGLLRSRCVLGAQLDGVE